MKVKSITRLVFVLRVYLKTWRNRILSTVEIVDLKYTEIWEGRETFFLNTLREERNGIWLISLKDQNKILDDF